MSEKSDRREYFENLVRIKERRERGEVGGLEDAPSSVLENPEDELTDEKAKEIFKGEGKEDIKEDERSVTPQEQFSGNAIVVQEAIAKTSAPSKIEIEEPNEQQRISIRTNIEAWRTTVVNVAPERKQKFIEMFRKSVSSPELIAEELKKVLEQNPDDEALKELNHLMDPYA